MKPNQQTKTFNPEFDRDCLLHESFYVSRSVSTRPGSGPPSSNSLPAQLSPQVTSSDTLDIHKNKCQSFSISETHGSTDSLQQAPSGEFTSSNMSRKYRSVSLISHFATTVDSDPAWVHKKTHGAFFPRDTLTDPPNYGSSVNQQHNPTSQSSNTSRRSTSEQPSRNKSPRRQARAETTGPDLASSRPPSKRQKLDEQGNLQTRQSYSQAQNSFQDDYGYSSPSFPRHVSHRNKRASTELANISIPQPGLSPRGVEITVKSPRNSVSTARKPEAALLKADDSDDFEMLGMTNEFSEPKQRSRGLLYAGKSVATEENGANVISSDKTHETNGGKFGKVLGTALKSGGRAGSEPTGRAEKQPSNRHETAHSESGIGTVPAVIIQTTHPRAHSIKGTSSSRTLNRRDSHRSNKLPTPPPLDDGMDQTDKMDQTDEMDRTDELAKSPINSIMVPLSDKCPPNSNLEVSRDQNPDSKSSDTFQSGEDFDRQKMKSAEIKEKPAPFKILDRQHKKKQKERLKSMPLRAYFSNPNNFTGPLKIHGDSPRFVISQGDKEIDVIDLQKVTHANFSEGDEGVYAQLKGPRFGKHEYLVYLVFESNADHNSFRGKFNYSKSYNTITIIVKDRPESVLECAYERKLHQLRDFADNHTPGSHRSKEITQSDLHSDQKSGNDRSTRSRARQSRSSQSLHELPSDRETARRSNRNSAKNGQQSSPNASSARAPRFRPYTEAMKTVQRWKEPLRYTVGETGRQIATVDYLEIEHLQPGEFLNDSLIWFGLRYMMEKHPESSRRVHFFNTYFYPALTKSGRNKIDFEAVKKWTAKQNVDIFSYDYVVVPINHALHWYLAIICNVRQIELRPQHDAASSSLQTKSATVTNRLPEFEIETRHQQSDSPDSKIYTSQQQIIERNFPRMTIESTEISDDGDDQLEPLKQANYSKIFGEADTGNRESSTLPVKQPQSASSRENGSLEAKQSKLKEPKIITLDSLDSSHPETLGFLRQYLAAEALDKHAADLTVPRGKAARGIPFQTNYCDCGLYLIAYVDRFLADPDTFVEFILSNQMSLEYWPEFVADELRDNFREIVLEEGCKQNGIAPAPDPASLVQEDYSQTESCDGYAQVGHDAGTSKDRSSHLVTSDVESAEQAGKKAQSRPSTNNHFKVPSGDESSSPNDIEVNRKRRTLKNASAGRDLTESTSSDIERPKSRRNSSRGCKKEDTQYGEFDVDVDSDRPPTRGKGR